VANGATPRDLVTAALPVESITMICTPSLVWMRNILSTQQQVPERVDVPAVKAIQGGREMAVPGLTQRSKVYSEKAQTYPKYNRTGPKDWISKHSEVNPMNAQGRPKYNIKEQEDRRLELSEIYSVKTQVCPNHDYMNPEDQITKLFEANYNRAKPEDRVSKLSEVDSVTAQVRTCKGYPQSLVQHDYHDHANDSSSMYDHHLAVMQRSGTAHFPRKLYELLDSADSSVISWQPHGRAVRIHNVKAFVEKVMPLHFSQSKLVSFKRQLNLYGFLRITQGRDEGAYYHELFLRGRYFLVNRMRRQKVKGTKVKLSTNPDTEPDFYSMPSISMENQLSDNN
jgi:hypothetical protein